MIVTRVDGGREMVGIVDPVEMVEIVTVVEMVGGVTVVEGVEVSAVVGVDVVGVSAVVEVIGKVVREVLVVDVVVTIGLLALKSWGFCIIVPMTVLLKFVLSSV